MTIDDAIGVLQRALREPWRLPQQIEIFQQIIWKDEGLVDVDNEVMEILYDLAYDLDFHEPSPEMRSEDASYFGDDKALAKIQMALDKIGLLSSGSAQDPNKSP